MIDVETIASLEGILSRIPKTDVFQMHFLLTDKYPLGIDMISASDKLTNFLVNEGFANRDITRPVDPISSSLTGKSYFETSYLFLTDKGRELQSIGSYSLFEESIREKERIEEELLKLNLEKLKFDVKNARRIFNTYWWTFGFSIVAFVVSIILLLDKLGIIFKK